MYIDDDVPCEGLSAGNTFCTECGPGFDLSDGQCSACEKGTTAYAQVAIAAVLVLAVVAGAVKLAASGQRYRLVTVRYHLVTVLCCTLESNEKRVRLACLA